MTLGKAVYEHYEPAGKGTGMLPLVEHCRTLEIGFGSGALLKALAERDNDVYGVDAGKDIVEKARGTGFTNVFLVDVSEESLPFEDDFFDAVYCYEVFEHLTNPHRMFSEISRVLKPQRPLFFSVPAQEVDMGYGIQRHTFVYPGLLEKHNLERFLMQMYFRIDQAIAPGPTDWLLGYNYVLENMKHLARPDVVAVVTKDWSIPELYDGILPEEELEREVARELDGYARMLEDCLLRGTNNEFAIVTEFVAARYPREYAFFVDLVKRMGAIGRPDGAKAVVESLLRHSQVPDSTLQEIKVLLEQVVAGSQKRGK